MRTWAFVAQKGGGGKSSLAISLGCLAEQKGEATLIVDMDRQGSVTFWARVRNQEAPSVVAATHQQLRPTIDRAKEAGFDLVLLDTAGHEDTTSLAAMRAADLIIVPVRPLVLDVAAIADTADLLRDANKLGQAVAVLNQVTVSRDGVAQADEAAEAISKYGLRVAARRVGQSDTIPVAIGSGLGVTETSAETDATPHSAVELRALWQELITGKTPGRRARRGSKS